MNIMMVVKPLGIKSTSGSHDRMPPERSGQFLQKKLSLGDHEQKYMINIILKFSGTYYHGLKSTRVYVIQLLSLSFFLVFTNIIKKHNQNKTDESSVNK